MRRGEASERGTAGGWLPGREPAAGRGCVLTADERAALSAAEQPLVDRGGALSRGDG